MTKDSKLVSGIKRVQEKSSKLHKLKTVKDAENDFKQRCINQIRVAVHGLKEIGINCYFDESAIKIIHNE